MRLKTFHPILGDPKTYMTASASAGVTALTVANNAEFTANDYVVIGKPGQENTRIHKIASLTNNDTITVDALKFAISANTPIYYIKYNQVKFLLGDWSARYETGTISITKNSPVVTGSGVSWGTITVAHALLLNGKWYDILSVDSASQITLTENYTGEDVVYDTYALVSFASQTGSLVDISIDQDFTSWDDTDSLAEDYYRSQYYNSTTTLLSAYSSVVASSEDGYSDFALKTLEDEVLSEMRDKDAARRGRDEVDADINNAIREMLNAVISDILEDYLSSYDTINFKSNKNEYPLFDDFKKLTSVWISYNGVDYKKADKMKISDDLPDASYSESSPNYYLRDGVIGVRPTPTANVTNGIKVWYDRRMPSLRNPGDELPNILKDYKRPIIAYALEKGCFGEDQSNKATQYRMEFMQGKSDMIDSLSDRDPSNNNSVEIVNDMDLYL